MHVDVCSDPHVQGGAGAGGGPAAGQGGAGEGPEAAEAVRAEGLL